MPAKDATPARTTGAPITPETPYREAMTRLIGERWEAVWAALPAAIDGTDPEGVHDVRVASRRLRAAMDVAREAFPKPWFRRLHRTAKAITGALGEVRDRDVLLAHLGEERDTAKAAERPGIGLLIARVEAEREVARAEMLRFLQDIDTEALEAETRRRFAITPGSPAPDSETGDRGSSRSDAADPAGDPAGDPGIEASRAAATRAKKKRPTPESIGTATGDGEVTKGNSAAKKARGAKTVAVNAAEATASPAADGTASATTKRTGRMTPPAGRRGRNR